LSRDDALRRGDLAGYLAPTHNRPWNKPADDGVERVYYIHRASGMAHQDLSEAERAEIRRELERLREEHRDLDAAIEALDRVGAVDRLQMQRLKKKKLALRDKLTLYEDMLTPDIIA
jgi:hypothetical protein